MEDHDLCLYAFLAICLSCLLFHCSPNSWAPAFYELGKAGLHLKVQWITQEPLVAVVPKFDTGLTWIENWQLALPHTVGSCVSEITPPQSCKQEGNRHLCERKMPLNPWMSLGCFRDPWSASFKLRPSRLLIRYRVHDKQPTTLSPWTLPPDTLGQCSTLIFGSFHPILSKQRDHQNLTRLCMQSCDFGHL